MQDTGAGYAIESFVRSSWLSIVGAIVLTALVWGYVLLGSPGMNKDLRNPLAARPWPRIGKGRRRPLMLQRVTALGLIFLTLWFVFTVVSLAHADFGTARATLAKP